MWASAFSEEPTNGMNDEDSAGRAAGEALLSGRPTSGRKDEGLAAEATGARTVLVLFRCVRLSALFMDILLCSHLLSG
jgi:hypothetical protein